MSKNHKHINRRKFIGQASCAAIGASTLFSTLFDLKLAAAMATSNIRPVADYKALVCILLAGGNDSFNMLVPRGSGEYQEYQSVRSTLALPQGGLLPIYPTSNDGKEYGVHPSMSGVQSLFNDRNLAFISNVGTLVNPTTKTQYNNESVPLPLGLFSHADQIQQWQTSIPDKRAALGWGGRMADILRGMNNNQQVSMSISMSGNNIYQAGSRTTAYAVDAESQMGSSIRNYNNTDSNWDMIRSATIDNLMDQTYANMFDATYADIVKNSQEASDIFNAAIMNTNPINTVFSPTELSTSLKMVAQTIAARSTLDVGRQTFFIVFGGWDHHEELINSQEGMLGVVSNALKEFYDSTVDLGIQDEVTSFTISDFARTLTSNGKGSDHAWGGNAMVMGGSVKGGKIYGNYPDLYLDSNVELGKGRGVIIPTTSADEYFAELALWFGVSPSDLNLVLPNIANFYAPSATNPPIGFIL